MPLLIIWKSNKACHYSHVLIVSRAYFFMVAALTTILTSDAYNGERKIQIRLIAYFGM